MLSTLARSLCLVLPLLAACDKGPTKSSSELPSATVASAPATIPATAAAVAPSIPSAALDGTKFGAGVTRGGKYFVGAGLMIPIGFLIYMYSA